MSSTIETVLINLHIDDSKPSSTESDLIAKGTLSSQGCYSFLLSLSLSSSSLDVRDMQLDICLE